MRNHNKINMTLNHLLNQYDVSFKDFTFKISGLALIIRSTNKNNLGETYKCSINLSKYSYDGSNEDVFDDFKYHIRFFRNSSWYNTSLTCRLEKLNIVIKE